MKKRMSILVLALFMTALTACGTSGAVNSASVAGTAPVSNTSASSSAAPAETADQQAAKQVVLDFFAAAKKQDYKTMKSYCTKSYSKKYVHEKGKTKSWFGFKNAALQNVKMITGEWNRTQKILFPDVKTGYLLDVTFKGETVPGSSLWVKEHPIQENSCYFLVQKIGNIRKITSMEAS